MRSAAFVVAVLASSSAEAADQHYFVFNQDDEAVLTIVAIEDQTLVQIRNMITETAIGTPTGEPLDRADVFETPMDGLYRVYIKSNFPVLAHVGRDCCGNGGTSFVPVANGHTYVGNHFVLYFPMLRADALRVFAQSDGAADVAIRIQDEAGNCVVDREIADGDSWTVSGLVADTFYTLVAEGGTVAVQHNAPTGVDTVPPFDVFGSCNSDLGTEFFFATHSSQDGAAAIFTYSTAVSVEITRISDGEVVWDRGGLPLDPSSVEFVGGLGLAEYRLESSAPVGVWAGATEDGEGIESMGDDSSQMLGGEMSGSGRVVWAHGQTHGGAVFAGPDGATVTIDDGVEIELDPVVESASTAFVDLAPGTLHKIESDFPVLVSVGGGGDWDDWGTFLRPLPTGEDACDAPPTVVPDSCDETDAGPDASPDAAPPKDAGADASPGLVDATPTPVSEGNGGGCACRVASTRSSTSATALAIAVAWSLHPRSRRRRGPRDRSR